MRELRGRVAVVTGAAGGLGRALARRLGRDGARLALWDLDARGLEAAAAIVKEAGGEARAYRVDASDAVDVRRAAEEVRGDLGETDLLINAAGVMYPGGLLDLSDEAVDKTVDVNLKSYVWCTRAFLPGMLARDRGHLVFIASAAGLVGVPGMAVYAATKHGVVGLAESARQELRRAKSKGVGLTLVCPSFISTGMFDGVKPPLGSRWLEPDVLADSIVDAVREGRSHLNEPFLVKLIPWLKLLPAPVTDRLSDWLGLGRALEGFKGSRTGQRAG